jgi:hypothetical protein
MERKPKPEEAGHRLKPGEVGHRLKPVAAVAVVRE